MSNIIGFNNQAALLCDNIAQVEQLLKGPIKYMDLLNTQMKRAYNTKSNYMDLSSLNIQSNDLKSTQGTAIMEIDNYTKQFGRLNDTISNTCKVQSGLNEQFEKFSKIQQKASKTKKITTGLKTVSSVMNTVKTVTDENLTSLEKWSAGFSGVGNALMLSGNPIAMGVGVGSQIVGIVTNIIAEKEKKEAKEIAQLPSEIFSNSDNIASLKSVGKRYDYLRQIANSKGISNLNVSDQKELYSIMNLLSQILPKYKKGWDDYGRVITNLNVSTEDYINTLKEEIDVKEEKWLKDQEKKRKPIEDIIGYSKTNISVYTQELRKLEENLKTTQLNNENNDEHSINILKDNINTYKGLIKNEEIMLKFHQDKLEALYGSDKIKINYEQMMQGYPYQENLKESKEQFINKINELKNLSGYLNQLDAGQDLASSTEFRTDYPQLISYLNDEKELRYQINDLIAFQEDVSKKAYKNILMDSAKFYNELKDNNQEYINKLNDNRLKDLKGAKTLSAVKMGLEAKLNNNMKEDFTSVLKPSNLLAVNNIGKFIKGEEISKLPHYDDNKMIKDTINMIDDIIDKTLDESINGKDLSNVFKFDGSGSNNINYATHDVKLLVDEFVELNNEINTTQNKITKLSDYINKLPEDSAKRIKYIEEENKLLKQQQNLFHSKADKYRDDMKNHKKTLINNDVKIIGENVDFESYADKVKYFETQINKSTGNKRNNITSKYNEMKDAFKSYVDAQNKYIPELQKKWVTNAEAIKRNKIEIDEFQLLKYDKQLEEISNSKSKLGEISDKSEIIESTRLFSREQNILGKKLSYTEELLKQYKTELEGLSEETDVNKVRATQLISQIDKLNGQKAEIEINIIENYESQKEKMLNSVKDLESKVLQVIEKRIEEEQNKENDNHKNIIENINDEKEKLEEKYDIRLKALREQESQLSQQEKMNELLENKSKLEEKINKLSLDNSVEAKAKKSELQEDLAKVEKNISKETHDYQYRQLEEQINKEREDKLKSIDESIEAENNRHEIEMENFEEQLEKENLYKAARELMLEDTTKLGEILLQYQDKWGEGFSIIGDNIKNDILLQLEDAARIMKSMEYSQENNQLGDDISNLGQHLTKPGELKKLSDEEYKDYLNNKLAWLLGDEETKKISETLNKKLRLDNQITTDSFNYLELLNLSRDRDNKITKSQFEQAININKLLEVNGDVTDSDQLQDNVDKALSKFINILDTNGIYRPIS